MDRTSPPWRVALRTGDTGPAGEALVDVLVAQHLEVRALFRAAARADVEQRDAAYAALVRYLALHVAAEWVALTPPGRAGPVPPPGAQVERRDLTIAVQRMDDLGTGCPTFRAQLAELAAVADRHVLASETDRVPRFVATHADEDLQRAVDALQAADALAREGAPDRVACEPASFEQQVRAARTELAARLRGR